MKSQKIIIVDDEPIILNGLRELLTDDFEIVTFQSAEEFLSAFSSFEFEDGKPTCILLDFQMPGMNGVELQVCLKQINVEFPIIFMSGNAQQKDIISAWHQGARDFILKPFTPKEITDAIKNLFNSIQFLNIVQLPRQAQEKIYIPITKREAEVLLLLGDGIQQYEIAEMLGISLRTVKMYRSNLKEKLCLNTLMELGRYCDQHKTLITKIAGN